MEFFGLTSYGVTDPIKDMLRPDYKEPTVPPKDMRFLGNLILGCIAINKEQQKYLGDGNTAKKIITQIDRRNILDKKKGFAEKVKELDCYLGITDGYAYGSWDRLTRMRKKHNLKPVGPYEMFLYPGVSSMHYGWWHSDPILECDKGEENWYQPRARFPLIRSYFS